MQSRQESIARLALHSVLPTQSPFKKKLAEQPSLRAIAPLFKKTDATLSTLVGKKVVEKIRSPHILEKASKEYELLQKSPQIEILFFQEEDYPQILGLCNDPPLLLYKEGSISLNSQRSIAIVGTRNASTYARQITKQLIQQLAPYQPTIVSGLAYGIDAQAHKEALENNLPTIAVLGSGLQQIYPQKHYSLAKEIVKQGALISEYKLQSMPDKYHFPLRNRIIAGMTNCTLIIESDIKGGAMITAYVAASYHREVMTIPHALSSQHGKGCHLLIKKHIAHLIESAEDIAKIMGWEESAYNKNITPVPDAVLKLLGKKEKKVYDYILENPNVHADSIAHILNIPLNEISMMLLQLELQHLIIKQPGNIYITTAASLINRVE